MKPQSKLYSRRSIYFWLKGSWLLLFALVAIVSAASASYYLYHYPLIPCSCSVHQQTAEAPAPALKPLY